MTREQLNNAIFIKTNIDVLEEHKNKILKTKLTEISKLKEGINPLTDFTLYSNIKYAIEFINDYLIKIEEEISNLERQFKSL